MMSSAVKMTSSSSFLINGKQLTQELLGLLFLMMRPHTQQDALQLIPITHLQFGLELEKMLGVDMLPMETEFTDLIVKASHGKIWD